MPSGIYQYNSKISPINHQSEEILKRQDFALIGVSPFNSYFSAEQIYEIISLVSHNFNELAVFIPDKISSFTLKALGYGESRTHHKIRKQDNYLKNKVIKALDKLNLVTKRNNIIILSEIMSSTEYTKSYNLCLDIFNNDKRFREGCLDTSSWVLTSYEKTKGQIFDDQSKAIAVEYFLWELPIFLNAPKILNKNSCLFIYNSIPDFLTEIYNNYNLASENQGFAVYESYT